MTFRESGHHQPQPQPNPQPQPKPVSIVKTAGKGMKGMVVAGGIHLLLLLLAVILIAAGAAVVGWILGFIVVVTGAAWVRVMFSVGTGVGKALLTVGPDGVSCGSFRLPWGRVIALDFVDSRATYLVKAPQLTAAVPGEHRSVVVTSSDRDTRGRPVQYGMTFYGLHSENYDEIRAAARAFRPGIGFRTTLTVADYVLDQARVSGFLDRLAAEGRIDVVNERGKPRAVITADGISADGATLRWADTVSVLAHTFVSTVRGRYGVTTTSRRPRLAFGLAAADGAAPQNFQFKRGHDYLDYPNDHSPTIEEFSAILARMAPHVRFADQRTGE